MKKIDFNHDWTVKCLTRNAEPKKVTLPHDAMIGEPRKAWSTGADNIGYFCGGDYEYTKTFSGTDLAGQNVVAEFESVYMEPEVYLNGEKIGSRPYGYTNFYIDLTGRLKDENEIKVIAHNNTHPNSRWYSGTGIYRPVFLWVGEEKHIAVNGVRVRTLSINPARIEVKVQTTAPGEVLIAIPDLGITAKADATEETGFTDILSRTNSEIEAAASGENYGAYQKAYVAVCEIECRDAKLWSTDDPNLYTMKVTFAEDEAETTFGIRTLTFGQDGICINGERVILRGACIHHDNGVLGACTYPEAEERRVRIMKENGYNAIRSAHNPCSKYLLDACDKLGVLMMDEFVDCWYIHKTKYDYVRYAADWWKQDFKDMVDKDYNHPSVVMYSTGNEVAETSEKRGIALTKEYTDYLHYLDDSRSVSCGINIFFNFLYSMGMGVYSDDKAGKAAGEENLTYEEQEQRAAEAGAKAGKKKAVGSEFYNMLACALGDNFMKFGAWLPMSDWKTKDAFANMDVAGYNYGLFRYKGDLKKYPNRLILGSETFCKDAYKFYEIARDNPRIVGDFVWAGIDYIGEAGMGASDFSDYVMTEEEAKMTGDNGRIDLNGNPRVEALYTRVALDQEKGPYIAVLPMYDDKKPVFTGWKLSKALESYSWPQCEGRKMEVEVYARAASVELFVNNTSVGRKNMPKKDCRVVFHTEYHSGEIKAVSYDAAGQVIGEKILKTAGEDTVFNVTPESNTVHKEGLVYIPVEYTDSEGIWKPAEKHTIHVEVENGRLLGLGNAAPYTLRNYTDDTFETYFARALAVVQADGSGDLKVKVSDESETKEISVKLV